MADDSIKIRFFIPADWRKRLSLDDRITLEEWFSGEPIKLRARRDLLTKFVCDERNALLDEKAARQRLGALVGEEALADAFGKFMEAFSSALVPPANGDG